MGGFDLVMDRFGLFWVVLDGFGLFWVVSDGFWVVLGGSAFCKYDQCLYIKSVKTSNGKINFIILPLYADDILPVSNNMNMINSEKKSLKKGLNSLTKRTSIYFRYV